jgi:hypothetical protein
MSQKSETNHGEGNPEAANRFNAAEQEFVKSKRGQEKIKKGAEVRPPEKADLRKAETAGRAHAKSDPSDTM